MLDVEQRAGVTVVRLRHGKVSALDLELARALTAVMRDLDGNGAVVSASASCSSPPGTASRPGAVTTRRSSTRSGNGLVSRSRAWHDRCHPGPDPWPGGHGELPADQLRPLGHRPQPVAGRA